MNITASRDGTLGIWIYRHVLRFLRLLFRIKRKTIGTELPEWAADISSLLDNINLFGTLPTYIAIYCVPRHLFRCVKGNGARTWLYRSPLTVTLHTTALLLLVVHFLDKEGIVDSFKGFALPVLSAFSTKAIVACTIAMSAVLFLLLGPLICFFYDLLYWLFLLIAGWLFVRLGSVLMLHLFYSDWVSSLWAFAGEVALSLLVWKLHRSESPRYWATLFNANLNWARYFWGSLYLGSAISFFLFPAAIAALSFMGYALYFFLRRIFFGQREDTVAMTSAVLLLIVAVIFCTLVTRLGLYLYAGLLEASVRFLRKRFYAMYCASIATRVVNIEVINRAMNGIPPGAHFRLKRLQATDRRLRNELRGYLVEIIRESKVTELRLKSDVVSLSRYRTARNEGLANLWDLSSLLNRADDVELLKHLAQLRTEPPIHTTEDVTVAPTNWLKKLSALCRQAERLLVSGFHFGSRIRSVEMKRETQIRERVPFGCFGSSFTEVPESQQIEREHRIRRAMIVRKLRIARATIAAAIAVVVLLCGWWELYWSRSNTYVLSQIHDEAAHCADDPNNCHDLGWIPVLAHVGDPRKSLGGALALDGDRRSAGLLLALDLAAGTQSEAVTASGSEPREQKEDATAPKIPRQVPKASLESALEALPIKKRMSLLTDLYKRGVDVPDRTFAEVPAQLLADVLTHLDPKIVGENRYTISDVESSLVEFEAMMGQLKEINKPVLAEGAWKDGVRCWELMHGYPMLQVVYGVDAQIPEPRWQPLWDGQFDVLRHGNRRKTTRPFPDRELYLGAEVADLFSYLPPHENIGPALAFSRSLSPAFRFDAQAALGSRLATIHREKEAIGIAHELVACDPCDFKSGSVFIDQHKLSEFFEELSKAGDTEELTAIADKLPNSPLDLRDTALEGIALGIAAAQEPTMGVKPQAPSFGQQQSKPQLVGGAATLIERGKCRDAWVLARLHATSESAKWRTYDAIVEKLVGERSSDRPQH